MPKRQDFIYSIGDIIKTNNGNSIEILDTLRIKRKTRNCTEKFYKFKCLVDGYIGQIREYDLVNKGTNCPVCSNRIIVKDINSIYKTHNHLVKYFKNIEDSYTHSCCSNKIVEFKCVDCGYEKKMKINDFYRGGFNCKNCSDKISYPEKLIRTILVQLNINFKCEYSPDWIKPKRYDFYLPDYNLIIEMDGGWHNKDNNMSGQTSKKSKEIDNYKDLKAKEYGIEVIRIDCDYSHNYRFEYIKNNIINSKLSEIFNLDNIDWILIELKSEDNIVKKVCSQWDKIKDTKILANKFKINRGTIIDYLKRGNKLGWCDYNPKDSYKKAKWNPKKDGIHIICINNDMEFKSISECSTKSLKLFGVKISRRTISRICDGIKSDYNGYVFKYKNNN